MLLPLKNSEADREASEEVVGEDVGLDGVSL